MNDDHTEASLTTRAPRPRPSLAEVMTGAVLLGSIVIAVLQPAWLTVPLRSAVENAGVAAPILFVLLCATAAPLHLNGVLVRSGARRRHGAVAAPVGRRQEQGADGSRVFVI